MHAGIGAILRIARVAAVDGEFSPREGRHIRLLAGPDIPPRFSLATRRAECANPVRVCGIGEKGSGEVTSEDHCPQRRRRQRSGQRVSLPLRFRGRGDRRPRGGVESLEARTAGPEGGIRLCDLQFPRGKPDENLGPGTEPGPSRVLGSGSGDGRNSPSESILSGGTGHRMAAGGDFGQGLRGQKVFNSPTARRPALHFGRSICGPDN